MKIVADDKIPYLKGVLEPYAEVVYAARGGAIAAADVADAEVFAGAHANPMRRRTAGRITGAAWLLRRRSATDHIGSGVGAPVTGWRWSPHRGAMPQGCCNGVAAVLAGLLRGERSRIRDGWGVVGSGPCRFAGGPLCAGVGLPGAVLRSAPASRAERLGAAQGVRAAGAVGG